MWKWKKNNGQVVEGPRVTKINLKVFKSSNIGVFFSKGAKK